MEKVNYQKIINKIGAWIQKQLDGSNSNGFVYGISGGIDSALIAAIAQKFFANKSLGLLMNIENSANDIADQKLVIKKFQVQYLDVNLESIFNAYLQVLPNHAMAKANLKARIRMNVLYYYAQAFNYLVCGTSNAAEIHTGYFTKYGDSGSDFMPLANLLKKDVVACAQLLDVPYQIITKKPSAGLYANQTDETELGVSYQQIDAFLLNQPIGINAQKKINQLFNNSNHKRQFAKSILPLGKILRL